MIEYVIICTVALLVSGLTFFAGFGLGTLLMPAFALFFPLPIAIAATAVVHLTNNLFKVILIGKKADWSTVLKFGVPGFFFSMLGAYLLSFMLNQEPLVSYQLNDSVYNVTIINLIVGGLVILFALIDLLPTLSKIAIDKKHVFAGGALSGFFGGLSGHQGALRTTFLIKFGLEKETFIATGILVAVIIDIGRLLIYGFSFGNFSSSIFQGEIGSLVLFACLFAFAGAYVGRRLLKKVTFRFVQLLIGSLLIVFGLSLILGLI